MSESDTLQLLAVRVYPEQEGHLALLLPVALCVLSVPTVTDCRGGGFSSGTSGPKRTGTSAQIKTGPRTLFGQAGAFIPSKVVIHSKQEKKKKTERKS